MIRLIACLVALLPIVGCAPTLMPTPVIYADGGIDPFAGVPEVDAGVDVPVFIATDREPGRRTPGTRPNWNTFYSKDRGRALLFARATVRLGKAGSAWSDLVEASRAEPRTWDPPVALTNIEEFGALGVLEQLDDIELVRSRPTLFDLARNATNLKESPGTQAFVDAIDEQLARSQRKHLYIFVHGFNTNVRDNTIRAASLWHYLGRDGAMVSFDWPSRNSAFAYSADKATSRVSVLRFRLLLRLLHEFTDAERIHIVAHSAGSPVVVRALSQLRLLYDEYDPEDAGRASKLGQVILAAPDMDLMAFENAIYDGADQICRRMTLYVSTYDEALSLSAWINGFARLGSPMKSLEPEDLVNMRDSDTLQVVDVAVPHRRRGSAMGHSYFHEDPWVSSDLFMLLRYGATPEERGLVRGPNEAFWEFPEDFGEVAPRRAQALEAR